MGSTILLFIQRSLYQLLWVIICLPLLFYLWWRYQSYSSHQRKLLNRFGVAYFSADKSTKKIWIHLASVGEVKAAIPLVKKILEFTEDQQIIFSTNTPTGEKILREELGENIFHVFMPFDLLLVMKRFLQKQNIGCILLFETEVWPSVVYCSYANNIPLLLINSRLSENSCKKYRILNDFSNDVFRKITHITAQSSGDAQRFKTVGAQSVSVTGSIKADISIDDSLTQQRDQLKQQWSQQGERKIIIAASTHAGEDEIILAAFSSLKEKHDNLLLVITPRHPERFAKVANLCQQSDLNWQRKSENKRVKKATDIVLADTMGELLLLCGVADIVIMGGTFIERGGHNFLEPAAWGVPIVSGHSDYNFVTIAEGLCEAGGLAQVDNEQELVNEINLLLNDESELKRRGVAARDYVDNNRGALDKLFKLIKPYLPD